jgi:hypothetical protein
MLADRKGIGELADEALPRPTRKARNRQSPGRAFDLKEANAAVNGGSDIAAPDL